MVHTKRRGLVIAGAITFGVSWGIAATISVLLSDSSSNGISNDRAFANRLWIPVVGPILADYAGNSSGGNTAPVLWSITEAAGLAMFIVGMVGHEVPDYEVRRRRAMINVAPVVSHAFSGLALHSTW